MFAVPLPLGLRTTTQVSFMTELNLSASSDLLPTTFRGRGWRSLRQTAQSCTATLAPGCPSSESQSQGSVSRVLPWMGRVRARRVERTSSLSSQFGHPSRRNSAAVATKEHSRHARSFLVDILTVECVCNSYNQARACLGRAALDSCPIWCSMCRSTGPGVTCLPSTGTSPPALGPQTNNPTPNSYPHIPVSPDSPLSLGCPVEDDHPPLRLARAVPPTSRPAVALAPQKRPLRLRRLRLGRRAATPRQDEVARHDALCAACGGRADAAGEQPGGERGTGGGRG